MNKRGFVFTFIALVMTGVLILFFITDTGDPHAGIDPLFLTAQMNAHIDDIDADLERGLYITSFRTILSQIERIIVTGEFLESSEDTFIEGMLNATIEGEEVELLEEMSFSDWLEKAETLLATRGMNLTYHALELSLGHDEPFAITVTLHANYTLTERSGMRRYERSVEKHARIPIQNLEDPAYYVKSLGRLTNQIIPAPTDDVHDLIALAENNSHYLPSTKSPTFFMRFEGNFSAAEHGIESIVHGQRFYNHDIFAYEGRSNVDTLYFSDIAHTPECVNATPSWFRLDDERIADYTNVTVISC